MTVFGYYGHAAAGIVIGAALLAHGYFYQNERNKTVGIAALIVLAVVERNKRNGQIQLAATVDLSPFRAHECGLRLGLRAHCWLSCRGSIFSGLAILPPFPVFIGGATTLWNVVGGAVIGLVVGLSVAKQLIPASMPFAQAGSGSAVGSAYYWLALVPWPFSITVKGDCRASAGSK